MAIIIEQDAITGADSIIGDSAGNEYRHSQSFVFGDTSDVLTAAFHVDNIAGSPSGVVTVRIETDSAGSPSGTLAHANLTQTLTPAVGWNKVTYTTTSIAAGTYWMVLLCDNQSNDVGRWISRAGSGAYASGEHKYTLNGGSWTAAGDDLTFRINSGVPSASPSRSPSVSASISPSVSPSQSPSASISPSVSPSQSPSASISPSVSPSVSPSISPSLSPSTSPSISPSLSPSTSPSISPSLSPSTSPSVSPSRSPSISPSTSPSLSVSVSPSVSPSISIPIKPHTRILNQTSVRSRIVSINPRVRII